MRRTPAARPGPGTSAISRCSAELVEERRRRRRRSPGGRPPPPAGPGRRPSGSSSSAAATRLTPDRERPAAAALVAGHRGDRPAYDAWPPPGRPPSSVGDRQQRDHLGGEVDARDPRVDVPVTCRQAAENRSCHRRRWALDTGSSPGRGRARPRRPRPAGPRSQPNASACSSTYAVVAGAAQEQVAQEVALVLVLDGGDRLLAGDQQRRDGRGPLQRVHVVGGDRPSRRTHDEAGQVGAAGGDPQRPHLALADRCAVGADALDPEPAGRVDAGRPRRAVARAASSRCGRPLAAVGRGDQHPDVQDAGDLLGDPRRGRRPRARSGSARCAARRPGPAPRLASRSSSLINMLPRFGPDRWQNLTSATVVAAD